MLSSAIAHFDMTTKLILLWSGSAPPAFLSKAMPSEMQGEAMGALNAASSVCRIFAPMLAGIVSDPHSKLMIVHCSCIAIMSLHHSFAREVGRMAS